jgi:hypothetical protein
MKVGSHLSLGSSRPCGDKPERNNMIKAEKKISPSLLSLQSHWLAFMYLFL